MPNTELIPMQRTIPTIKNNLQFGKRESCRQIDDRKWHCIALILCHLRSSIFGALAQPNCKLFLIVGIRKYLIILPPLNEWYSPSLHKSEEEAPRQRIQPDPF